MKKFLFIARRSDGPYAMEEILSFTENTDSEINSVRVIQVNVPHYSLIHGALLQIAEKLNSGEFLALAGARELVQEAVKALEINPISRPSRELVDFVAGKTFNSWLHPSFCIYANAE